MQLIAELTWPEAFFGSVVAVCAFFLILIFGGVALMLWEDRRKRTRTPKNPESNRVANKTTTEW